MIVQLSRFVLAALGALAGSAVVKVIDWTQQTGYPGYIVILLFVIMGAAIGFILGGIIGRELTRAYIYLEDYVRRMSASEMLLGAGGLLVGLVVALIVSNPIRMLRPSWLALGGTIAMFWVCAYGGIRVALVKRGDFSRLFGMGPDAGGGAKAPERLLLDTSAVIDGRFVGIVAAGFARADVRVPAFVLVELQTLSDSADEMKRTRGKRGLDLLTSLRSGPVTVEVFDVDYPDLADVDSKLVRLAKDSESAIVTVDHNLTQVARVQGAIVLDVNELAVALRPNHLPGERIHIPVVKEGKEPGQGVGYLEDGTMVVVADGRDAVGTEIEVVVTSMLQTSGGRMLFAKPWNES